MYFSKKKMHLLKCQMCDYKMSLSKFNLGPEFCRPDCCADEEHLDFPATGEDCQKDYFSSCSISPSLSTVFVARVTEYFSHCLTSIFSNNALRMRNLLCQIKRNHFIQVLSSRLLHRNSTFVPPAPPTRTRRRSKTDFRQKRGRSGPFFINPDDSKG